VIALTPLSTAERNALAALLNGLDWREASDLVGVPYSTLRSARETGLVLVTHAPVIREALAWEAAHAR
jgi:hypothetical protein